MSMILIIMFTLMVSIMLATVLMTIVLNSTFNSVSLTASFISATALQPSQLNVSKEFIKLFKVALGAARIKFIAKFMVMLLLTLPFSTTFAQNAWSNYRSVEKKPIHPIERPIRQPFAQPYGQQSQRGYHWNQPAQPHYDRAQQGGVQIIFNQSFPTQTQHYVSRRAFVNGQYLPELYRNPQYQIHNWSAQRLPQPLYGRYWVLVDGYYLLIKADNFQIEFVQSL